MTVNLREAKARLAALIDRALAGRPVVVLKPVVAKPGRELGAARGLTREKRGWDAAMTDAEADAFLGIGPG